MSFKVFKIPWPGKFKFYHHEIFFPLNYYDKKTSESCWWAAFK